jgi:addiction module RelE/StbE family toxin
MEPRWSPEAADDLVRIVQRILQENPSSAERIASFIIQRVASLENFPHLGKPGRVEDTRELPLPPLPFVVVYRLRGKAIEVARVLHGAQRWP